MAKRETKETYKDIRTDKAATEAKYQQGIGESGQRIAAAGDPINAQREALTGGYSNMPRVQAHTIADPRDINVSELRDTLGGYKAFRDTGGLSGENINRMRGMGGFDEFSKTGGYTPEAIANIKAQALSPISSYATGTRDELNRQRSIQGGYSPGFDAANRQLQRDTARAIADTSLNANVGIQDRINQGRMWGIGGLTNAEQTLAGMQTGNRLAALGGETGIGNSLSSFDAQNVANDMNAGMFNAGQLTGADLTNLGQYNAGMSGLQGLYNMDVGQYQTELDRRNALLGGQTQANLGYLGNQGQLAVQPGIGGNVMGAIGTAAGLAATYYTGGLNKVAGAAANKAQGQVVR